MKTMPAAPDFQSSRNAVHRWSHGADALFAAAAGAHLPVFRLDGAAPKDKKSIMAAFASALALPRHFGHNWDALADCLMDGAWLPPAGCVIAWLDAQGFAQAAPEDFAIAEDVLGEAAKFWKERGKAFHVFLL